jgi:hypothetical protein
MALAIEKMDKSPAPLKTKDHPFGSLGLQNCNRCKKQVMVKTLRKRHLQIWTLLMVLIPAGIISARLAIPHSATSRLLQPMGMGAYPVIVKTVDTKNYTVRIRQAADSSHQLEWINKVILTVPTCTIYSLPEGTGDIKKGQLIGRIEAMGTYHFPVPPNTAAVKQLVLYDFIHQQIIDTIHF